MTLIPHASAPTLEAVMLKTFQSLTAFSGVVPQASVELAIGEAFQSTAAFVMDDSISSERRVEVAAWIHATLARAGRDLLWQIEGRLAAEYGRSLDEGPFLPAEPAFPGSLSA
jgi:hypothetical protein